MRDIIVRQIEDSVPIPVKIGDNIPIRELEIGQSVVFDLDRRPYVQSVASRLKARRGMEFTVKKISDNEARVWRVS